MSDASEIVSTNHHSNSESSVGNHSSGDIYNNGMSEENDDDEDLILQSIKHSPYDEDLWLNKAEADALGKYDDFHTIDWSRDRMRDRIRFRKMKKMKYKGTLCEKIKVGVFV